MPRQPINLHQKIREMLQHTAPLPAESGRPIDHFDRTTNDNDGFMRYVERHLQTSSIYQAVYQRHMASARRMVLASHLQAFERFIKEMAIVCVDEVAELVFDGRLDRFEPRGAALAANFRNGTVGRALCESDTLQASCCRGSPVGPHRGRPPLCQPVLVRDRGVDERPRRPAPRRTAWGATRGASGTV